MVIFTAAFKENGQRAFELALRRDGVVVERAALNFLSCYVNASESNGLITYAWAVRFWDFSSEGLQTLLWEASGLVTLGRNNFTADSAAQDCADGFANAWLAQNPPA